MTPDQFQPLTNETDPRVVAFLEAWHENNRDYFHKSYSNLDYDKHERKHATSRKKYICLDCGSSGVMMAEKATGLVFGIKGYGRIHRGHPCGRIDELTDAYQEATANNKRHSPTASIHC